MKILFILLCLVALALVLVSVYVRFAPSPARDWHPDIAAAGYTPPANAATFCPQPGSRYASATTDLTRLDEVAMGWPRTTRLAATEENGELTHVTWITRSALFGFPDYTTAQIKDWGETRDICVVARQRFGTEDLGVNAKRLRAWLQEALGLQEAPDLGWPGPRD